MVTANEQFVIDVLSKIDWFSNCGSIPENIEDIVVAETHDSVIKNICSTRWLNITLDAKGEITVFLCLNHREEYNRWNTVIHEINQLMEKHLLDKITSGLARIGLSDDEVLVTVLSDIRMIIAANAWENYIESPFYQRLLSIYQAGHLPCGWKGTPAQGKLMVY